MATIKVGDEFVIEGGGAFQNSLYRKYVGRRITITGVFGYSDFDDDRDVRWNVEGTKEGDPGWDDAIGMKSFWKFAEDVGLRRYKAKPNWEV